RRAAPALPCKRQCLEVRASLSLRSKPLTETGKWLDLSALHQWARHASRARPFGHNPGYFLASSNSIFLAAGSSLEMRKLRICPAEDASGLAAVGEAPLFHRDCSMELSEDRSAGFAATVFSSFAGASSTIRQAP